jgi:3-hydroxyisobutyrate dehydrogenase-like beta-hydroxyacid dehydrogenase
VPERPIHHVGDVGAGQVAKAVNKRRVELPLPAAADRSVATR